MIRGVRYRDLAAISSIHRVADWNPDFSGTWPSTQGTLLESILPARSTHSYVLEEGGQIYGFVQARPRSSYDKWDIIRLVATVDRPGEVWLKLLEYVCVAAGNRRVTKLFANVPEDGDEPEIFRQIGFYRFGREHSLSLPLTERGVLPDMPAMLREAAPGDAFAILQLYSAVTPRHVQQAEGLAARDYQLAGGRFSGLLDRVGLARDSGRASCSWVAEEDSKIFAWFRLRWREGRCRMSCLIHPDKRAAFPELRDYVVGAARATRPCILGVQVRDYHEELLPLFEEIGFQSNGQSLLLVKHIAVQVMERRLAPVLTRA